MQRDLYMLQYLTKFSFKRDILLIEVITLDSNLVTNTSIVLLFYK